jgi:nucleoside-diphosphate-sugar epimerase
MCYRAVVTGAGGFIGHHLVKYLKGKGYWIRGVDIKKPEFGRTMADEFILLDLRDRDNCLKATDNVEEVYQLAADMGGIGFITAYHARIARNNTLINLHMLEAARINDVARFLYSSSACIYPQYLQRSADVVALKEEKAYPADPEKGYGWEKLYAEELCKYYREEYRLETRIVRFHNVYGPLGSYEGGREKAPAALCRKIVFAQDDDTIEVWGDGEQTRSFMYVDDCVEGIHRLMESDFADPLNLGTDRLVTINELVRIISEIATKRILTRHDLSKPQGVRGRNSDNSRLRKVLDWEPSVSLEEGLSHTYHWIESELEDRMNGKSQYVMHQLFKEQLVSDLEQTHS